MLKSFTTWLSQATGLWRVLELLFPSLGGFMTGWLAALGGVPAHLVLFYSLGAVCFCALSVACVHYVIRYRAIYERLRYAGTEPLFVNPNPTANTIGIMFKCKLMNMSQTCSMYIELRRCDARLQGRTNTDPVLKDTIVIVPPFSDFAINTAAVPDINVSQEIKGKLEIEIAYGPSPDDLRYLLAYELEPRLDISNLTDKNAQILFTGPLKKYQHKRA